MIPGALTTSRLGPTGLNFGKESKWYVTHIEDNSGYFYLQQSDSSISVKYERLSQEIEAAIAAGKLPCFNSVPGIGELCVAQFTEDELWYRGQILSIDEEDNAELIFIDYGNGEVLPWKALRVIPGEFRELPPQAIQCRLANIDPVGGIWSKKAIKLLRELVLDRELVGVPTHLCKTGAVVIKLFGDVEKSVVVAKQLVIAGFAHWKKVKSSLSQSSSSTSSSVSASLSVTAKPGGPGEVHLKAGSHYDLCLSHIESLDCFYCQPIQYRDSFRQMDDELQQFYSSSQHDSFKLVNMNVGQFCCAKFSEDKRWYRGIIKQVPGGNRYEVQAVDYGHREVLPVSEIKELVTKFHHLPVIGLHCGLHGIKPADQEAAFDEEIVKKFEDMIIDKDLVGLVNTVEDSGKVLLTIYDTTETRDGVNVNKELGKLSKVVFEKSKEESSRRSFSSQSVGQANVQLHFVGMSLNPGDAEVGYVAFAVSPFDFSCQVAKNLTNLDNMMNDLNNEYASLKPGQQKLQILQPGTPCCARYSEDGRFYRAELVKVEGLNAKIYFVDYGNDEQCRADELKHLKKEYLKLPKQAFKCKLSGIEIPANGSFSLDACKKFNDMVIDKEFTISIIQIDSDGCAEVSLVEKNDSNVARFDAAEVLVESGLASQAKSSFTGNLGPTVSNKPYAEVEVPIGDYVDVMPTSVVSPDQFCCQLFEKSDVIDEMMAELENAYKNSQAPRNMQLRNGMPCVALYPVDNLWYRAVLVRAVGQQVDVSYVDYGNKETLSRDNIRPMYAKFMSLPAQAFVCSLDDVKPKGSSEWSKACITEFSNMVVEKQLIVLVKKKDKSNLHHVELLDTLTNREKQTSIAELLIEKGFAQAVTQNQGAASSVGAASSAGGPAKASPSEIPTVNIKEQEDVEITFVENPSLFFCQQTSAAEKVEILMGKLEDTYTNIGPNELKMTSPKQGSLCAAKFSEDGAWYRAKIVKVVDRANVEVQYIDYGNCEVAALNDLKELKGEFLQDAAYALHCSLAGISSTSGNWEKSSVDRFKSLLDYKVLSAKFHTKQPPYQVSLFEDGKGLAETALGQGIGIAAASSNQNRGYNNRKLDVGTVENVYVAHIDDMSNIYCQLTRTENALYALMDEIAKKVNTLPKVSSVTTGKAVSAMFSEDNGWYRGVVEDTQGSSSARVRFVDYGNFEEVKMASLRELASEWLEQPKHALLCSIDDGNCLWKDNAADLLLQLTGDKVISMAVKAKQGEKYLVELRDESGMALTSKLASQKNSPAGPQRDTRQPLRNSASARLPLPKPKTGVEISFYVTHVDSFSEIYIQDASDTDKIDGLMQKLEEAPKEKVGVQTVEPGLPYIAIFSEDQAPYRAVVEKKTGSNVSVRFIDYGNAEEKSISELFRLPQDMLNIPSFSIKCALKNGKKPSNESGLEKFREIVFDKTLKGKLEPLGSDTFELAIADESIAKQFCSQSPGSQTAFADIKINPGASLDCYISHIEALTEFYVQPCHVEADLNLVATQVAKAGSFPSLNQSAQGQVCCANFSEDGQWYRGEVLEAAGGKIKVRFVDYGNSDVVERTNAKSVSAELLKVPRLAIPCAFAGVQQSSNDDIEKFANTTLDQVVSVKFNGKDSCGRNTVSLCLDGKALSFGKSAKNPGLQAETKKAAAMTHSSAQSPAVIVEFNDKTLSAGTELKVFVSYVVTAQEFYCQLSEDTSKLDALMEKLHEYAESAGGLVSYASGVPCAAKYSVDGGWYRAALECLDSQTHAKVKFVDYGNFDSVSVAELKELSGDLLEEPAFAVKCSLVGDVGPATDFENRVMDQELTLKVVGKQGGTYMVDLICGNKSIAQELLKQKALSNPGASANVASFKKPELQIGSDYDAYFLDGISPSKFYCQLAKDEIPFEALMNTIYEHAGTLPVLDQVKKGISCIGLFSEDGSWYRGTVLETRQGEARLLFVDYGNEEWVKNENIKEIPKDIQTLPLQAVQCCLAYSQPATGTWTDQEKELFKGRCADKTFSLQVVSSNSESFSVVLKDKSTGENVNDLFGKSVEEEKRPAKSSSQATASFQELTVTKETKYEALGTFVKPTGHISCQLVKYEGPLGSLMDDISIYCDGISKKVSNPVVGQACLALFPEDDSWYRGKIVKVGGAITVKFVDFGNEADVPLDDIREARPVDLELSVTCLDCIVPGIPVRDDVISFLEEQCVNQELIVDVKDVTGESSAIAHISLSATGESIKDMLLKKFSATLPKESDTSKTSTAPAKKFKYSKVDFEVNSTENMLCSFVRSLDTVEAHVLRYSQEFDEMMDKIAVHCGNSDRPLIKPYDSQCCLGKYPVDGGWYRAVILSTSSDILKLRYVDYGNEDEVSFADVREMTEEFMQLPALGITCKLHDVHKEDLDSSAGKQWLENSCLNNEYSFKFMTKADANGCFDVNMSYLGSEETVNDELYNRFALEEEAAPMAEVTSTSLRDTAAGQVAAASSTDEKSTHVSDEKRALARFKEAELGGSPRIEAICSFVDDGLRVHCQPLNVQEELEKLMVHISHYCAEETGQATTFEVGMACFAQFADDNEWYRAEIIKVEKDQCTVHYVDYGNTGVVNKNQIKAIAEPFLKLPKASVACLLEGTASFNKQNLAVKTFLEESLLEAVVEVAVIERVDAGVFEAKVFVDGHDVNALVKAKFVNADLAEGSSSKQDVAKGDSSKQGVIKLLDPSIEMKVTKNAICTHVESLHQVYCQLTIYQADLDVLSEQMQTYCNGDGGSQAEPVAGNLCLARFTEDEMWYRAVITEVLDGKVKVTFVDYGNTDIVSLNATRALTGDFSVLPKTSIKCSLHDVHDDDLDVNAAITWLQENVLEQDLNVEVVEVVDGTYDCILSQPGADGNINDQLYALFEVAVEEAAVEEAAVEEAAVEEAAVEEAAVEKVAVEEDAVEEVAVEEVAVEDTQSNKVGDSKADKSNSLDGPSQSTNVEIAKFDKLNLEKGATDNMVCVHVDSLHEMYCQLLRYQADLDAVSEKITQFCETSADGPRNFEVGMACLAQFTEDGVWYRAEVVNVIENDVEVHFVDYGNKDRVLKENTRVIGSEFMTLPATAFKCSLHDVHNEDLDVNAAVQWLQTDVIGQELTGEVVDQSGLLYDCILFKPGAECNINDELYALFALETEEAPAVPGNAEENVEKVEGISVVVETKEQEVVTQSDADRVPAVSEISHKFVQPKLELGAKESVYPVHVDSIQHITCQLSRFHTELESLSAEIEAYCENSVSNVENFEAGLACLAKFTEDGVWYRAEVKSVEDNQVGVYFVDYRNEDKVAKENTRAVTSQFTSLPVTLIACQLHDVFGADIDLDKALVWLHKIMIDHELTVEVVGKVDDVYDCVFYKAGHEGSINDLLYEKFERQAAEEDPAESKIVAAGDAMPESEATASSGPLNVQAEEFVSTSLSSAGKSSLKCIKSRVIEPDCSLHLHLSNPVSPSLFWCQFDDTACELIDLMSNIRSRYSQGDMSGFTEAPEAGTICCAQFSEDNEWYRGEVVNICDEESCMVKFIDYGNIDGVHLDHIRQLEPDFFDLPRQAVKCRLHGVKAIDAGWSEESIDEFSDICGGNVLEVDVLHKEDDVLDVIVKVPGIESTVNQFMIEKGYGIKDSNKTNGIC